MAQNYTFENDVQQTVDFSTVSVGNIFIYSNAACVKLNNNNPNYTIIGTGAIGKLEDTDQIVLPNNALVKLE